jgi:DNA gyrase subunit A
MVLVTSGGQAIRFAEEDVRPMGRNAAGVIGIRLGPGDEVIASAVVRDDLDLLVVSAKGLGKRTEMEQYRSQGRGGKGIQAMRLTDRTGKIVAAGMVSEEDAVMLMNSRGITIRIAASQISKIGRTTQGVTLMRLGKGEEVASMTIINPKDPESSARLNSLESDDGSEPAVGS